jgi:beta-N-acetylhexosaminidase
MPPTARRQSRPGTTRKPERPKLGAGKPVSTLSTKGAAKGEAWVKRTLRGMTLEEKLGQLIMITYYGEFTSAESAYFQELARQVARYHIGSLMVETRPGPLGLELSQAYPTAALANLLQGRAKIPLLIAADFERGTAMRLKEGTSFPHAMAVAATGRPTDAYTMGRITALEARAVGVRWIFAPVADVNSDPANPIINVRSFGEDPKRVSEFVQAYIRGVQDTGALATAKHFPGHGETNIDSHLSLPTVGSDRAHIDSIELAPFRAAIAAGADTIMTGHLAVPALEPERELPATFSKATLTDLLRRKMRFDGLIATDALNMGGVALRYPTGEAAVRSLLAGADVLLAFENMEAGFAGLREAAKSGRLPMSRIDDAVTRVLRAKARLGLYRKSRVSLDALATAFGKPEFARAAAEIADRGITLLRDGTKLLPLDATLPRRVLLVNIAGDPNPAPGLALERAIRPEVDSLQVLRADVRFNTVDKLNPPSPASYDLVIVALFVRITNAKGSIGLPDDEAAFVHGLLASAGKPMIVACFGNPYLAATFPESKTWLAAFSSSDVAQHAAGRALFGQIAIGGRIPVGIPGVVPLGAGLDVAATPMKLMPGGAALDGKLGRAYDVLKRAVADHAFPGCVVAVGYRGQLATHAFGKMSDAAGAPAVKTDTIYDVASLTKPVVTATLAAMMTEEGQLSLDAPVARYLPEWAAGPQPDWRGKATVRNLLTHTAGLPAHQEYFKALSRRVILARAAAEPLAYEPGTQAVYSDLGFMLLGEIIERLVGKPLDELARERVFAPLGSRDTLFRPSKSLRSRIAPTENDTAFRKMLVRGEVHDENAWAMGGVAGHAGLFSTAGDLATFCQLMLNGGQYAHARILKRSTVAEFTAATAIAANTQTLGWAAPTANSSSGRYFSAKSFGHLGYTGTSLWIDPDKQLFVVLLTNRVNPTRANNKIKDVRPALHDAVVEGLGLAKP